MVLVEKEDADKANLLADFYFSIYTEEIDEGPGVSNKIYNECKDITLTTQLVATKLNPNNNMVLSWKIYGTAVIEYAG